MNVSWRPVHGFEGLYEVSDAGDVRSLDRLTRCFDPRWKKWRVYKIDGKLLKQHYASKGYREKKGYLFVSLYKDAKRSNKYIHHLVAEAFIGKRPDGMEVAHNNGVRNINCLSNLRYDTSAGNNADKLNHGTVLRGERHQNSKISEDQAKQILALKGKLLQKEIGKLFGLSKAAVSDIISGRNWAHLQ
jgi:NUMOD4 motif/HNH endonuclease